MNFALQRFGQYKQSEQASSLKTRDYKDATDLIVFGGGQNATEYKEKDSETVENVKTIVRRLTPLECERLQGLPDNWTLIGEPEENPKTGEIEYFYIDTNGKKKKVSDSARYRALGNSIATPFWRFLARRICAQYERDITLGSLFDGIGGFPYVFKKAGAKPVWASEIEEFCIAVTKERFPEE